MVVVCEWASVCLVGNGFHWPKESIPPTFKNAHSTNNIYFLLSLSVSSPLLIIVVGLSE